MMPKDQLPRQLLVCAPAGGKCSAGGQKQRWNGAVASDLKKCNLSGTWREYAQECNSWCTTIHHSVEHLNIEAENNEKSHKDEKKCHHEQRLNDSETALHCNHPGCFFQALTKAGLPTIITNIIPQFQGFSWWYKHTYRQTDIQTDIQTDTQTSPFIHIGDICIYVYIYGLESTILLEPHVCHLESFVICCLMDHPGCLSQGKEAPYHHAQDGKAAENIIHPLTAWSSFSQAPFKDAQRPAT